MPKATDLARTLTFLSEDAKTLGMSDLSKVYENAAINRASEAILTCENVAAARMAFLQRYMGKRNV